MAGADAPLTEADIQAYWRDGYLLVHGLVDAAALQACDQRFCAFARGDIPPAPGMKLMRDIMVVKGAVEPATPLHAINKMINFEDDAELYGYVLQPRLLAAVRALIGDELVSVSTNVFNKPPGVDGRHPFHQDLRYFRIRPADGIVGTWTALADAPREAGCLAVLPGTHRGALLDHGDPDWEYVNAGFYAAEGVDASRRVHVEMQRGDTLLFHPLLIHGSGHNRSAGFRRAISAHYASANCESPVGRDWRTSKQARVIAR